TAQRSIEDAEEAERERRRRAREASCRRNSGSTPGESYDSDLKPSGSPSLEEDEGFSDWTQRRERRRQQRLQELSQGGEEDEDEEEDTINKAAPITERTESLNRSLKKSNSFKKTQPLVLTSKIDDKLEQYAHAVEVMKASLSDLPSSPEVVASKKNLFEAGEAWTQSPTKGATCKVREQSGTRLLPAPTSCR
uniref:Lymphocyte specific protein 1 a n=1 Tax=Seriola dumerili TaxID=41447 RepID=A0A3B4UY80_SERDU